MILSQKVAFNTLIQIVSKATTVVFGLLTTILLTGYLGREGYGNYMLVMTMVIMFGALADWGTAIIGVREASKEKEKQAKILAEVFLIRLGLALGAAFLMFLAAFFLPLQSANQVIVRQGIMLGSLILILFAIKVSFGVVFQTKLQMEKLAAVDITMSVLIFLVSWYFIRLGLTILFLVGAVIIAGIVALLVAWFLAWRTVKFEFRLNKKFVRHFFDESLPMGAILLMFTVDNKIDTVMLGSIKGSNAVGIYAIAYRIYDVLILGAAYLMNALLPVISQYSDLKQWGEKVKYLYQKAFDILLLMGIVVVFLTWLLAPLAVKVLTQQRYFEFFDAVFVLRILAIALFLAYFNHLTGYTIVALGKQRPYFFIALSALIFNVTANLILIPRLSYYGAATVTILTEGLVLIITTIFIFRLLKIIPSVLKFPGTAIQLVKKKGAIF